MLLDVLLRERERERGISTKTTKINCVAAASRFVINTRSLPHNSPRLSKRLEIAREGERKSHKSKMLCSLSNFANLKIAYSGCIATRIHSSMF